MISKYLHQHTIFCLSGLLCAVSGCGKAPPDPRPNLSKVAEIRKELASTNTAATTAAAVTGTGWATLKGQFIVDGDAPTLDMLKAGGDPKCAAQIADNSLVIDSASKGIADFVVYPRKASRVHESWAKPASVDSVFDQKGCMFLSPLFIIRTDQKFVAKNSDETAHNVNISDLGTNSLIPAGQELDFSKSMKPTAVPITVSCNIHGWMKASALIRDVKNPYVGQSVKDGKFEIANLPAGEPLEFQVWHSRDAGATLTADDIKVNKGKFTVTLKEGETKEVVFKISPKDLVAR